MKPEDSIDYVLGHQQADGGFPYPPSGGAVLEATAFSLLAVWGRDPKSGALKKGPPSWRRFKTGTAGFFFFPGIT